VLDKDSKTELIQHCFIFPTQ